MGFLRHFLLEAAFVDRATDTPSGEKSLCFFNREREQFAGVVSVANMCA